MFSKRQPALWGLGLCISQLVPPPLETWSLVSPSEGGAVRVNSELRQEGFQRTQWGRLEILVRAVDRQPVVEGDGRWAGGKPFVSLHTCCGRGLVDQNLAGSLRERL